MDGSNINQHTFVSTVESHLKNIEDRVKLATVFYAEQFPYFIQAIFSIYVYLFIVNIVATHIQAWIGGSPRTTTL